MNYTILTNFIIYNIFAFSVISMIDLVLYQINDNGRWFLLHSIVNGIIVYYSVNDTFGCFQDPNNSILPIENKFAGAYAVSLHIYHYIHFKMSKIDYIHHFVSVFAATPLCMIYQTRGISMMYFFGTGLPGGINYLCLYLMKNDHMNKLTEKKINSYLNNYVRAPGLIITSYILWKDSLNEEGIKMGLYYSNKILSLLFYLNGSIFSKMAIENYVETKEKRRHLSQ